MGDDTGDCMMQSFFIMWRVRPSKPYSDGLSKRKNIDTKRTKSMDEKVNVLLVDDNADDLSNTADIIRNSFKDVNLLTAGAKKTAMEKLSKNRIDLLLLDVVLTDGTGFDIAKTVHEYPQYKFVHIVFITGYKDEELYAFRKYHCYSFINKPFNRSKLMKQLEPLINDLLERKKGEYVPARRKVRAFDTTDGEVVIPVDEILYADSENKTITIHTTKGNLVKKTKMTMKEFLEYIDDPDFYRCHKSYAVNLKKVTMIKPTEHRDSRAVFANGDENCVISQRNCHEMKSRLEKLAAATK